MLPAIHHLALRGFDPVSSNILTAGPPTVPASISSAAATAEDASGAVVPATAVSGGAVSAGGMFSAAGALAPGTASYRGRNSSEAVKEMRPFSFRLRYPSPLSCTLEPEESFSLIAAAVSAHFLPASSSL